MMLNIEKYNWSDHAERIKECESIRKDCSTARGIINDALQRYIKRKLNARNKKQAADMELMFKDLEDYRSEQDIQDAYGFDCISEKEYNRLIDLWHKRERFVDENGKFSDRVTELVRIAMNSIGEGYIDFLNETEEADRLKREREKEIEQENIRYNYDRYIKWL